MRYCATDSAPLREGALTALVRAELTSLGCETYVDRAGVALGGETGNLLARLPGTAAAGTPLLFTAHLDRVAGGMGADDAAGLAVAVEVLTVLGERQLAHPTLELACTVAEELGMRGAQHLDFGWLTARQAYCLDGEGPVGTVSRSAPHQVRLALELTGGEAVAGPAAAAAGAPGTAMQIAGYAMAHLELGQVDAQTTCLIGPGEGDPTSGHVAMWAEIRSTEPERLQQWESRVRSTFQRAADRFHGGVQCSEVQRVVGYRLAADAPVLVRARQAMLQAGVAALVGMAPGASDANVFMANGIETLLLGMGYEAIHTPQERMPLSQLVLAAELVLAIVLQ